VTGILTQGRMAGGSEGSRPVAVIDVGSNSVRLVVFDETKRVPVPIFNEKVSCGLGRGIDATGRLNPEGVDLAIQSLRRFVALTEAMGVSDISAVATAAVREAADGPDFIAAVARECGLQVRTIPGEEEARLSALGVHSAFPDATGMMGDLGGASVELVRMVGGDFKEQVTLPIGPIRVADNKGDPAALITRHLDTLGWLGEAKGGTFHAVGGAWRALARVHQSYMKYPLMVAHDYRINRRDALSFSDLIAHLSQGTLRQVPGISKRRVESLPFAALLLEHLIERSGVTQVSFSAYGLREGCIYDRLPEELRAEDPLIATARDLAWRTGRATADGEALSRWMSPAFPEESPRESRLRRAACLLADLEWSEHPDYRVEHALLRILRYPLVGVDHPGRAYLGLSVASRHGRVSDVLFGKFLRTLLDDTEADRARATGLAMRLGYTVSGGVISLLQQTAIRREGNELVLELPDHAEVLVGDVVQRRFSSLAAALNCTPMVVFVDLPPRASARGGS
jgi:exopolyphosphatase/guanosine-5'-triphosphate,3'-diphosphate pyrophosphatase